MLENVMDYNLMTREDLLAQKRFPMTVVPDMSSLHARCARILADVILRNNETGADTAVILPVGPLEYQPFAEICRKERVSLSGLSIYMMDEYLDEDDQPVAEAHPLSFRSFMQRSLFDHLSPDCQFDPKRACFPMPENLSMLSEEILGRGGVDLCFGGFGVTGHFAFNDPPEPGTTDDPLSWLRESTARKLTISRESSTQMAMGGTHGNWDILPRRACTLGMKELLASRHIHLTFMRSWHAGVLRRALFGPVSGDCPGSLMQEHPSVEVTLTELAAERPVLNVAQDRGK